MGFSKLQIFMVGGLVCGIYALALWLFFFNPIWFLWVGFFATVYFFIVVLLAMFFNLIGVRFDGL